MADREKFEAWYRDKYWNFKQGGNDFAPFDPETNSYSHLDVNLAWNAYQAAAVEPANNGGEIPTAPDHCPITGRKFWGNIEHPEFGMVATYGGPFDTYTIPKPDEDGEFRCEQFDQDAGDWVEGGCPTGLWLADEQPSAAPSPAVAEPTKVLFWYRPIGMDGLYEGPFHNNSVEGKMLRDAKPSEWLPLVVAPSSDIEERARKAIDAQGAEWQNPVVGHPYWPHRIPPKGKPLPDGWLDDYITDCAKLNKGEMPGVYFVEGVRFAEQHHGFASPLPAATLGKADERAAFEAAFPVPAYAVWSGKRYHSKTYTQWDIEKYQGKFEGFQAGLRLAQQPAASDVRDKK